MVIRMTFENKREEVSEMWIEPWPDCFRLKPGEKLTMEFDCPEPNEPMHVELTDASLVLWPNTLSHPNYAIDGQPANERNWKP